MKARYYPEYDLKTIKLSFKSIKDLRMTRTSMATQYKMGFSDQDVVDTIQRLKSRDFYKSMPPKHPKFCQWHDVCKTFYELKAIYIKFQADRKGHLIVSFKESTAHAKP